MECEGCHRLTGRDLFCVGVGELHEAIANLNGLVTGMDGYAGQLQLLRVKFHRDHTVGRCDCSAVGISGGDFHGNGLTAGALGRLGCSRCGVGTAVCLLANQADVLAVIRLGRSAGKGAGAGAGILGGLPEELLGIDLSSLLVRDIQA